MPVTDKQKNADVFWVGLSAVAFSEEEEKLPLSPLTKSGAFVSEIEKHCQRRVSFYKTNLVKCLPLHRGKIRYPLQHEMAKCYHNLETELWNLQPKIVFLLGKQVASFVLQKKGIKSFELDDNFRYESHYIDGTCFVPVHHPSFVLIYKRKRMHEYANSLSGMVGKVLKNADRRKRKVNLAR